LLGEILTEVREELMSDEDLKSYGNEVNMEGDVLGSSQTGRNVDCSHVFTVGLSLNPETDFGELQRKFPESNIFIEYLEKGILPVDRKWRRRIEHEGKDYFMESGKLWHKQRSTGRRLTFQEEITQLVVPISERNDVMDGFHTKALAHCGFNKTYLAMIRKYFWHNMYKMLKDFIRTLLGLPNSKKLP